MALRDKHRIMKIELSHLHHKDLEEGEGDVVSSEEAQLSLDFFRVVHPDRPLKHPNVIVVFLLLLEDSDRAEVRDWEVFDEIVSLGEP